MVLLPGLYGRWTVLNRMIEREDHVPSACLPHRIYERTHGEVTNRVRVLLSSPRPGLRLRGPVEHHTVRRLHKPVSGGPGGPGGTSFLDVGSNPLNSASGS